MVEYTRIPDRRDPRPADTSATPPAAAPGWLSLVRLSFQAMVYLVCGLLLLAAALYALQIFTVVSKLVSDPQPLTQPVEIIGKIIHADTLVWVQGDQRMEFGHTLAYVLLLFLYLLWIWIPLALMRAVRSVLTSGAEVRRQMHETLQDVLETVRKK